MTGAPWPWMHGWKGSCLDVEAGVHHCRWELGEQIRRGSFVLKGLGRNPGVQCLSALGSWLVEEGYISLDSP